LRGSGCLGSSSDTDGGSYGEVTLRRKAADLQRIALHQRGLRDVSAIDLSAELRGQKLACPSHSATGLPTRMQRGEVQTARAAEAAGVPLCLSTVSAYGLEEVAWITGVDLRSSET
jgi:L-lactate dehydrogenase (cytochrome)